MIYRKMYLGEKINKKEKIKEKIRKRYRVVVYNNDTYEEKAHFKLTLLNFFNILVVSSVLLIVLVTYLIAFTPLREYIPGYTDVSLNRRVYEMERRADSLEMVFRQKDLYIDNLKRIINGEDFETDSVNSLLTKSTKIILSFKISCFKSISAILFSIFF